VYQDIVRSLGAAPVVFPAIEMGAASRAGSDGRLITSPGGWGKTCRTRRARASYPGAVYTYFLIADKA